MTGFTIPGFDEDAHAASNGYGEQASEPAAIREIEPDLCIECYPQPCNCGDACSVRGAEVELIAA